MMFWTELVVGASTSYNYDSLNRLTSITYSNGTTISYTYDAAGNRLTQVVSSGQPPPSNFDETLNFNDGQLPSGWYIDVHPDKVTHTGVANQRFEARQIDTYSGLRRDVQLPANASAVKIEYTGNVTTNYWGQYTQANLLMDDGASCGTHLGKNWYGLDSIVASAGTGGAPEFQTTFPLDPGSYRITAIFEDEKITYTATKLGAGAPLFSEVVVVPGLDIHRLKTIELRTATTSGDPSWIDDVVIRALAGAPSVSFDQWRTSYFSSAELADPNVSGLLASPWKDGVSNLQKYLHNIDPSRPMTAEDRAALPAVSLETGDGTRYLTLTYRQNQTATGITVHVQESSDLATWLTVSPPDFYQETGTDPNTGDPIVKIGVIADETKKFIRLRVTPP